MHQTRAQKHRTRVTAISHKHVGVITIHSTRQKNLSAHTNPAYAYCQMKMSPAVKTESYVGD